MEAIFDVTKFSTFEYKGKPCVPGCCYCRKKHKISKIRDIDGIWHIINLPAGIEISDSYCPECLAEHYPELAT